MYNACVLNKHASIPGSNKPNTLRTNFSLIYNSGRAINQWCKIHANDPTESNKTSLIISHLNNHSFILSRAEPYPLIASWLVLAVGKH